MNTGCTLVLYAIASLGLAWGLACAEPRSLQDLPCPCSVTKGYVCCASLGLCLKADQKCPPPCAVAPNPSDYCAALPHVSAAAIDGVVECGLPLMPVIPTGWTGLVPQPASSTARFAAGWTSTGLYFYAEIDTTERVASTNDASLHCGDSLEIFVDDNGTFLNPPAYDARGTRQFVIAAPNGNESTSKRAATWLLGQSGGLWTGQYTSLSSATGFTVEALVDARDLGIDAWALQSGGLVGIDLAVNVGGGSDPSCPRLGQYAFRTAAIPAFPAVAPEGCVAPWCNTDAFCKPELRPRSPSR